MRQELTLYLDVAHETKKHVPRAQALVRKLWTQAHSRPFSDVWPALETMADAAASGVITGASIKSAFRRRMLKVQGGRCCYCRRWLVNTAYAKPIEHILPRHNYPQFSAEFWNWQWLAAIAIAPRQMTYGVPSQQRDADTLGQRSSAVRFTLGFIATMITSAT